MASQGRSTALLLTVTLVETCRPLLAFAAMREAPPPSAAGIVFGAECIKIVLAASALAYTLPKSGHSSSWLQSITSLPKVQGSPQWEVYLTMATIAGLTLMSNILFLLGLSITTPALLTMTTLAKDKLPITAMIQRCITPARRMTSSAYICLLIITIGVLITNLSTLDTSTALLGLTISLLIAVSTSFADICTERLISTELPFWVPQFWNGFFSASFAGLIYLFWPSDLSGLGTSDNTFFSTATTVLLALSNVITARFSDSPSPASTSFLIIMLPLSQASFFPALLSETFTASITVGVGILSVSTWVYNYHKQIPARISLKEEPDSELSESLLSEKSLNPRHNHPIPSSRQILRMGTFTLLLCSVVLYIQEPTTAEHLIRAVNIPGVSPPKSDLAKLCAAQTFTPGLWLFCHSGCGQKKKSMCGGLNNARNRVQTCLRLAIDAGASGIVMGGVTARSETDLVNTGQTELPPDAWWNTQSMQRYMHEECPQIDMQFGEPKLNNPSTVTAPFRSYKDGSHTNGTFRAVVAKTLQENKLKIENISKKSPVVVEFSDAFIAWDYIRSNEVSTVRRDLFQAVTYNKTILAMGRDLFSTPSLQNRALIGIHLRGESDWPAPFGSPTDQIHGYVESIRAIQASHPDIRHVYVSCGDRKAIANLRQPLQGLGYIVHDKWTLLEDHHPAKLAAIEKLGFDQRAIIEYEMLTQADFFMGPAMSSLSLLVAFARTIDHEEDFFATYLYPNSTLEGTRRTYAKDKTMRGPESTQLLVMSETDITPFFP